MSTFFSLVHLVYLLYLSILYIFFFIFFFINILLAIGDRGKGVTPPSPLQTIPVVPNPNKQQKPLLEWDIEGE